MRSRHSRHGSCRSMDPASLVSIIGKAPTFDGSGHIEGFLRNFGEWKECLQLYDTEAKIALRGALKGEAKMYEETVQYVGRATYADVCKELRDAYRGAAERYYNEITALKRSPEVSLAEHNKKFFELRARAGEYLTSFTATRTYINSLHPHEL